MGISKRELLEDYYFDELLTVFEEYGVLHRIDDADAAEEVSPTEFLGDGGEWM